MDKPLPDQAGQSAMSFHCQLHWWTSSRVWPHANCDAAVDSSASRSRSPQASVSGVCMHAPTGVTLTLVSADTLHAKPLQLNQRQHKPGEADDRTATARAVSQLRGPSPRLFSRSHHAGSLSKPGYRRGNNEQAWKGGQHPVGGDTHGH